MTEKIAVIQDNPELKKLFRSKVFVPAKDASGVIDKDTIMFTVNLVDKDLAEGNPLYIQFVTQVIIFNPKSKKIFISKRIQGEPRLIGSISALFGGHVNDQDFIQSDRSQYANPLDQCAFRELREELYIANKTLDLRFLGWTNDIRSSTSEHVGVIYCLITGSASVKEKETMLGKWVSYDDFKQNYYGKLESWSKAVFDYLYEDKDYNEKLRLN